MPAKVLIAVPGLDGHDRGAKIIAHELKENGIDVVYAGIRQTAEKIVSTALQNKVDVICLSIHSGAHMIHVPLLFSHMKNNNMENVSVVIGGIIPDEDVEGLKKMGVVEVFGPKSTLADIVNLIRKLLNNELG